MKFFRFFCSIGVFLIGATIACAAPAAHNFFDDTVLHDISLTLSPADWSALREHYTENTYYPAQFGWNGISLNIGIRSRGRGSRSAEKPALLLNISKYVKKQAFLGLDKVVLNPNNQDPSALHQWLTFRLFQRMGLPAPRQSFARLFINGDYFGFYDIVENVDEVFLEQNFGEHKGYLYEWQPNQMYHFEWLGSDPALYSPVLFEPQTHEDDPDPQPIVEFIQAINLSTDDKFVQEVSRFINPRLYLTHAAIETVVAEIDGIVGGVYGMNNFYIYRFNKQKLSQLIVWDKDLSFSYPERGLLDGTDDNILMRRLLAIPQYRAAYLNSVMKAINLLGGEDGWAAGEITRLYELIRDAARNDPHKQCIVPDQGSLIPCGAEEFEAGIRSLRSFLALRPAFVAADVEKATNGVADPGPVLTTVRAVNGQTADSLVAPGALVSLRGDELGADQTAPASPLPRSLDKVFVAVNGVRAPLLKTSSTEITLQIPWDVPSGGVVSLVAAVNGNLSNPLEVPVAEAAPTVIAISHLNGEAVSQESPATRGESLVIWMTGLGTVNQVLEDGAASSPDALASTVETPTLSFDDQPVPVTYSGLSPGYVGLYQVSFDVPTSVTGTSPADLSLTIQGHSTTMQIFLR